MKVIGKLPAAKGWVVHYNTKTGRVYGGYSIPIGLSREETDAEAAEQRDFLKENVLSEGDDFWVKRRYAEAEEEQHWACFDFMPVFRSLMTFRRYERGRSSVTMNFVAEDGSELAFGPSGIDSFIDHVASGDIKVVEGKFDLTFKLAKQGSNVYMLPVYDDSAVEWLSVETQESTIASRAL